MSEYAENASEAESGTEETFAEEQEAADHENEE